MAHTHRGRHNPGFTDAGAFPDMRSWGSGPGLGGWGAEGEPGASAQPYPRGPKGYKRSDELILDDLYQRLRELPELDATEVELEVLNGIVILKGTVPQKFMKRRIEEVADEIPGVVDIDNGIRIDQSGPKDTQVMGSE